MRRVHLFEFEDLSWFPDVLRDAMTAYLSFAMRVTGMLEPVLPLLRDALQRSGATSVVDLCSGAGFPAAFLAEHLGAEGVEVVCTDLYPNLPALHRAEAASEHLRVVPHPVDATRVSSDLVGLRTVFNGFHHFRPDVARAVLADAHDAGQPIAVVEVVDRRPANLLGMPFVPLAVMATLPFLRPFRWAWVPFTYLLPLIPLAGAWDGIVSCLRIYQPPELEALVEGLDGFTWTIERVPLPTGPIHATVLVGLPRA